MYSDGFYSNYTKSSTMWTTRPSGSWTTGLFDCIDDCDSCLCTILCPCVIIGQNIEIISEGKTGCGTAGLIWYLLQSFTSCGCLYTCSYRTALRQKFRLPAGTCPDVCVHTFCLSCALCQESRELKNRGWDPSITYNGNVALFQKLTNSSFPPEPQQMNR